MKKIILAITALVSGSYMIAQTEFDAQKLLNPDIQGTARYMSMAGAFGALGGDASAIKDNPGGLGIYRTSELTGTLNTLVQGSSAVWNGKSSNDVCLGLGFNNFSYVIASPTFRSQSANIGLLSSNWSLSYNRLKNFDRNSSISGNKQLSSITDYMAYFTTSNNTTSAELSTANSNDPYNNVNIPWISVVGYQGYLINETVTSGVSSWNSLLSAGEHVTPSYYIQERGSIDEYSIGWAGNWSNTFFVGVNANLQAVNYSMTSQYKEVFENGGGTTLLNTLSTNGVGVNLNAGLIYRPSDNFRLGLAAHSPVIYGLSENNSTNVDYYLSPTTNGNFDTPSAPNKYLLASPWKVSGSVAYLLGQKGLISAEYDVSFNKSAYFMDTNNSTLNFTDENKGIPQMLQDVKTLKLGAEYKLTSNLALRAGYANMSAGTNPLADKWMRYNTTRTDTEYFINNFSNFYTCGIGYRESNWYVDVAYVNKTESETFYSYNSFANDLITIMQHRNPSESNVANLTVKPASVNTVSNNVVITFGLKF